MRFAVPAVLVPVLAIALFACAKHDDDGTSISFNAEGGNVTGGVDAASGEVKLDVPGFSGKLKLPKIQLTADDFDLNGVHLYPGSKIDGLDVADGKGEADGRVHVTFTSPAAPATVRDWLAERLNKADFQVTPSGTGLTGTTDDHKPFRLDLQPDGAAASRGSVTIG